jgi:CoA-binding protein/cupredoxin-like protein
MARVPPVGHSGTALPGGPVSSRQSPARPQTRWVSVSKSDGSPEVRVHAGRPVRLIFCRDRVTPRLQRVNFPDHGVSVEVPPLQPLTVDLPAHEPGIYSFYCQPNAIQGKLIVEGHNGVHFEGHNGVHPRFLDDQSELALESEPANAAPQARSSALRAQAWILRALLEDPGFKFTRPVIDFLLLAAAVLIAQSGLSGMPAYAPLFALPPLTIALFFGSGVYRKRMRVLALDGIAPVLSGVTIATMAVTTIGVIMGQPVPSESVVFAWMCALAVLDVGRLALASTQQWARRRSLIGKPVLIAGLGLIGTQLAQRLENHPEYGLRPIGFLDDNPSPMAQDGRSDLPVLGTLADIDEIVTWTI